MTESASSHDPLVPDERYRLATEATNDAIWDWDLKTNRVVWNRGLETLFGYDAAEVEASAEWWYNHIHPEDADRVVHGIHEVIDGSGTDWSDEYRFVRSDGRYAHILDRGTVVRDEQGNGVRMIGAMQDVSEERALVANLEALEQRHHALIRALAQIVWTTNAAGEVEDVPEWRAYTGQRRDEVRGMGWIEALHPDDRGRAMKAWTDAVESGGDQPYSLEYRLRGWDGIYRWFQVRGVPIEDPDGRIREWVGVCIDINSRKETQAALNEREAEFRSLANSIPQLAWMADETGWIFWYNQRWYDYTGTNFEKMEGWGWQAVHHPDYVEAVTDRFRLAVEQEQPWEDTFPLRSHTGEFRWFLSRAMPIRDSGGRVLRWFGTNTDITEQRNTQEERERLLLTIERERERLDDIFQNAPAAIMVTHGPDHRILSANPAYRQMASDRPLVGRTVGEAFQETEARNLVRLYDRVYQTSNPYLGTEVEVQVDRNGDGNTEQAFFNFVYQPLKDGGETPAGVLVHAVEVTEQVRARQEVEEARILAEEANRTKSDFLATMSHELRTPLNAMIGYTDLLEMGIPEPIGDQAKQQVGRIGLSARHLLQLIEEILTFSRIEAGREETIREQVDISELANEVAAIIEPLAQDGELEFTMDVESLPPIVTDPRKLRQVLINLLGNAIKFTDQGSVGLRIKRDGDQVSFAVSDTGIGISEDHLEMIFEPFRQIESGRNRRAHGTGLGLSVSRRLVELMGGELLVESVPGQGSTFTISLPA